MADTSRPIGVVLAGGTGRRLGGSKATVELHGRPLIAYPIGALQAALGEVVVIAKCDSELPPLPGVAIVTEPDEPRHPLTGIVQALEHSDGRPVLVCAGDLPFASAALARTLADADSRGAPAVVPRAGGRLQPLFALYLPAAHATLAAALGGSLGPLTEHVAALAPHVLELADERPFFNVNVPEDLLTAAALMDDGGAGASGD
jgi:molybdopterin-guanine dinucleotide biosynthesis protein A